MRVARRLDVDHLAPDHVDKDAGACTTRGLYRVHSDWLLITPIIMYYCLILLNHASVQMVAKRRLCYKPCVTSRGTQTATTQRAQLVCGRP